MWKYVQHHSKYKKYKLKLSYDLILYLSEQQKSTTLICGGREMHFYTVAVVLQKQYKTYREKSQKIKCTLNISHKIQL